MKVINGIKCSGAFAIKKIARCNKMVSYMVNKHTGIKAVYDALEPMQVAVSASDVKKGIPLDPTKCPFAHGSCGSLKADDAYIGIRMACLKFGNSLVRFVIPESVRHEIVCHDRHRGFDPSKTYRLSSVPPYRRLGRLQKKPTRNGHKNPNRKRGTFIHRTAHLRPTIVVE